MISPAVRDLIIGLRHHPSFAELLAQLPREPRLSLGGLTTTAKAAYLVLLYQQTQKPLLILVDGNKQAEELGAAVDAFYDLMFTERDLGRPLALPALDVVPFQRVSPHAAVSEQRAIALWRLSTQKVPITITPVASALLRTETAHFYQQLALTLRVGEDVPFEEVMQHLASIGYEQREPVEMVGEYSVRGGILDVFPAEAEQPVRVELFGDYIESIRQFDVETQRSVLKVDAVTLLPLLEHPKSPQLFRDLANCVNDEDMIPVPGEPFAGWEFLVPLVRPKTGSLFQLLPDALVIVDEPEQVRSAAERFWKRMDEAERPSLCPPDRIYLRGEELDGLLEQRRSLAVRELAMEEPRSLAIATRPSLSFHGNMQVAVSEGRSFVEQGGQVVYCAPSAGELERLADILQEYRVPFQLALENNSGASQYLQERAYLVSGGGASTYLVQADIRRGTVFPESKLALIGAEDLFDPSEFTTGQKRKTKSSFAAFQGDIADLKPGDFIVHATHGIGQFLGIRQLAQGDQNGDFMLLEYSGGSKLYVPLTRLDLVTKFRGAGEARPSIDKLGGASWTKTKTRVKAKMRDMADELLKLYAQRKMAPGFAFSTDSNWQREFEDAFEYTATKDQLTAVKEIKRDLEAPHPMDRLLCGDVGFGKTEVAMRAAFKALGDGKQVAVLAPTTVLALQHFETFKRRFASFPVRIEMLSRFRSQKEIKIALEDIADGKVDVIIGTHRILSTDVLYRDLGLLIVDEEQRFGVRHKERLKQIRANIDVLTMSATPIPRTMHMSLLGLRDMSVIETPPKDRLAVHTVVAHYNPDLIKTAIDQELQRGGQVYFVHNRVDTIFMRAASIQEMMPNVRIGVGHGQMGEAELEKVLVGFIKHEYDVFVCTTIVENGIDIPLANTIIIENAERHGLSELYQLRGRVGRSNRRAYAYLLVPPDRELSEIARKRLAALKEFSDLGAGFKIAALDLELRGAGNLLGGEQHGHIEAIGFDTYLRLLEETVAELRGEEVPLEVHTTLNLGLDLRIPAEYISEEAQRLRAYKRIADADDEARGEQVIAELADRYGPVPNAVKLLVQFAIVKSLAQRIGVEAVDRRQGQLNVKFHSEARVDPARLIELVQHLPDTQFTPAGVMKLSLGRRSEPAEIMAFLADALRRARPEVGEKTPV